MKRTTLESSRRVALREPFSAGLSVLLHVLLIFGAVTWSSMPDTPDEHDSPESAQFLYPLLRPRPRPIEEKLTYVGLGGAAPEQVSAAPVPAEAPVVQKVEDAPLQTPAPLVQAVEEPPHAFSEIEVDSAAVRDPNSVGPVYPPKLLDKHVEGGTVVRFIVDSAGHVDPATIIVIESTHAEFTAAVRDVLPRMKYQPARMGRRPVAQYVEQKFGFRIQPPLM